MVLVFHLLFQISNTELAKKLISRNTLFNTLLFCKIKKGTGMSALSFLKLQIKSPILHHRYLRKYFMIRSNLYVHSRYTGLIHKRAKKKYFSN